MLVQALIIFGVTTEFTQQCLVILRHCHDDIIFQSLASLKKFGIKWYQERIRSVIIIPQMRYGQYYIVEGLCKSPHFSMGPKAVAHLQKLFRSVGVEVAHIPGYTRIKSAQKLDHSGLHVISSFREVVKNVDHKLGYKSLLLKLSKELWRPLLMIRANYYYKRNCILSFPSFDTQGFGNIDPCYK